MAKNGVESYLYEIKGKISDLDISDEEEREELLEKIEEA